MRVDDVPPWLAPAFHAFGYGIGGLLQAYMFVGRQSCRFEHETTTNYSGPRIECYWHEHLPAYTAAYLPARDGRRYVCMNHPAWYMRPVHVALGWNGVALALGSTGHGGQAALERVIEEIRRGASSSLAVDGPAGPAYKLKRGALDMARDSGAPIIAIRFEYEHTWRGRAWDRKHWPYPFSRIRIRESEPLFVNASNYEAQRARLTSELG